MLFEFTLNLRIGSPLRFHLLSHLARLALQFVLADDISVHFGDDLIDDHSRRVIRGKTHGSQNHGDKTHKLHKLFFSLWQDLQLAANSTRCDLLVCGYGLWFRETYQRGSELVQKLSRVLGDVQRQLQYARRRELRVWRATDQRH